MLTLTLGDSSPIKSLMAWSGPQLVKDEPTASFTPRPLPPVAVPPTIPLPHPSFDPPASSVPPPPIATHPPFPVPSAQIPFQPQPYAADQATPQAPIAPVLPQGGKPVTAMDLPSPTSPALPGVEPVVGMPTWMKWAAGVTGVVIVGGLIGFAVSR